MRTSTKLKMWVVIYIKRFFYGLGRSRTKKRSLLFSIIISSTFTIKTSELAVFVV